VTGRRDRRDKKAIRETKSKSDNVADASGARFAGKVVDVKTGKSGADASMNPVDRHAGVSSV
jgi:hypothetical protein